MARTNVVSTGVGVADVLAALAASAAAKDMGGGAITNTGLIAGRDLAAVMPLARFTLGADSTLTGAQANPAEGSHTPLPLTGLNGARRTVRWLARLVCTGQNASDTWRPRVYLGETVIADMSTIAFEPGQECTLEGEVQVRTIGVNGTFDSSTEGDNPITGEDERDSITGGAIDTTGPVELVVTNECSSSNAANIITLRDFSAEVWGA